MAYFDIDGFTYCGSRSYAIEPEQSWMKISNETLTIESLDPEETIESATFTVTVGLENFSQVSGSVEFNAELTCQEGQVCVTEKAVFTSVIPEEEVQLEFSGIGSSTLSPWIVQTSQRYTYKLPALVDPDHTEITVGYIDDDSELAKCNCYKYYASSHSILMTIPDDWPESIESDTLMVVLSHEKDTKTYQIPVRVIFNVIGINSKQELLVNPDETNQNIQQSVWADNSEYSQIEGEIDLSGSSVREVDPGLCLPMFAKTDSAGHINLLFNYPIEFKIDKEDVMLELVTSGAV